MLPDNNFCNIDWTSLPLLKDGINQENNFFFPVIYRIYNPCKQENMAMIKHHETITMESGQVMSFCKNHFNKFIGLTPIDSNRCHFESHRIKKSRLLSKQQAYDLWITT
jgi:hypothetical protein